MGLGDQLRKGSLIPDLVERVPWIRSEWRVSSIQRALWSNTRSRIPPHDMKTHSRIGIMQKVFLVILESALGGSA